MDDCSYIIGISWLLLSGGGDQSVSRLNIIRVYPVRNIFLISLQGLGRRERERACAYLPCTVFSACPSAHLSAPRKEIDTISPRRTGHAHALPRAPLRRVYSSCLICYGICYGNLEGKNVIMNPMLTTLSCYDTKIAT